MSNPALKKVGIAIDKWKLQIFERHFQQNGYLFTVLEGFSPNTYLLTIETANVEALARVINAANTESAKTGEQK